MSEITTLLNLLDRQVNTDYVEGLERAVQTSDAIRAAVADGLDVAQVMTQHLARHTQHKAQSLQAVIETTLLALQALQGLDDSNQKIVNKIVDALTTSIGASKLRNN
ncbi:hypothetical protein [Achromobacter phage Motura]|uniref:Uncharacterized protein n=1 Tax=Achromobacter phage Motura TaxID=2591403 RepID=A0A514CSJ6_9CAUD|nr:hypothetical protein H1O15_gp036 [Achromobacter phage Motura]QDH83444.1 hypothetical protein [Achromobacter phage Motura]